MYKRGGLLDEKKYLADFTDGDHFDSDGASIPEFITQRTSLYP
jgi:hypothetical protein